MNYLVKNLAELADLLRAQAVRLEANQHATSRADAAMNVAQANGFRAAANMVDITLFSDNCLFEDYRRQHEAALDCAGNDIWQSILRRNGDPRWHFARFAGAEALS